MYSRRSTLAASKLRITISFYDDLLYGKAPHSPSSIIEAIEDSFQLYYKVFFFPATAFHIIT